VCTLAFACAVSGADRSTSSLWRNLRNGTPQTLVIWGTSLCLTQYSSWPDSLKPGLAPFVDTSLLTIVNVSQALGNSSPGAVQFTDSVVGMGPDAVILEFASSDAVNRLDCTIDGCSGPSHDSIVGMLQTGLPGADIFLYVTAPPWDRDSCGATPCRYCTVVFAQRCRRSARASNNDTVEQYYDMVRRTADRRITHLVDTYGRFRDIYDTAFASYGDWLYDGIHPTALAARAIIVPVIIDAMRGKAVALAAPLPGDTLHAGEPMLLRWAYDPDSVNLVTFDMSMPDKGYWLPLVTQSIPPGPCSLWVTCPWEIQGDSVVGDSVYLRISQYNSSTIVDEVGPFVVAPPAGVRGAGAPGRAMSSSRWRLVIDAPGAHRWAGVSYDLRGCRVGVQDRRPTGLRLVRVDVP